MPIGAFNALLLRNPLLGAAFLRSRGYAAVPGLPGSPSGPAVAAPPASWLQRPSLITNQPVGANTGLFTPTGQPVGATVTAPSLPTLPSLPALPSLASLTAPNSGPDLGLNIGTPVPEAAPTPAPVSSGPTLPVDRHDVVAAQARTYRAQHGIQASDDAATDALNAESLAAARAGRTYLDPTLAAQYGQAPAAGLYGPRTDVVNALLMPTGANQ